ncbi:ubiquitin-conjugating enzyme E2 W-like [Rattus norvegicus]
MNLQCSQSFQQADTRQLECNPEETDRAKFGVRSAVEAPLRAPARGSLPLGSPDTTGMLFPSRSLAGWKQLCPLPSPAVGEAGDGQSKLALLIFFFLRCPTLADSKRLQKELLALQNDPPPGMTLNEKSVQNSITQWIVDMEGAPGTLYEGEKFQLLFKFSSRYPFDSPQVMFTGENIPVHPHVYSNGHICLSILTEDWSPALSVQSVCLSIISMLSSCKEKRRPPDNSFYVRTCNKNPKKTKWWYHDDTC